MKRLLFLLCALCTIACHAQKATTIEDKNPQEVVYRSVALMPQYPGGEAALMRYVQSHLKRPDSEARGTVIAQFVVRKDGSVDEVKIVRSLNPELNEEAIRVIRSLPKFTPGQKDGQPVNVWYTLPVRF